jgi:hypothetical protein
MTPAGPCRERRGGWQSGFAGRADGDLVKIPWHHIEPDSAVCDHEISRCESETNSMQKDAAEKAYFAIITMPGSIIPVTGGHRVGARLESFQPGVQW